MKLLFDQNLSHQLLATLPNDYAGSQHVRDVGLRDATDLAVWQFAAQHGYAIVTKDADFHQRSFLFGHPPKVIWLRMGNCPIAAIEALLRRRAMDIATFLSEAESAFLILD